jgi:2-C-methyl-D-erythritol 4-phosphate cytidylyltransferase
MRYHVVVPAAGSGQRFAATVPKQYAPLGQSTVIELALARFEADADCAGIVVALAQDDPHWPAIEARRPRAVLRAEGGQQRAHSVLNALRLLSSRVAATNWIMVHDAARPCFSTDDLSRLKGELRDHETGGLLAVPLADTLKRAETGREPARVDTTIDRQGLWRAATPQVFRLGPLIEALERALSAGRVPTDEAQAMEWAGHKPRLVAGRADNIKVTTRDDLLLASAILAMRPSMSVGES